MAALGANEVGIARHGRPEIFNTDQGSQFTGGDFTGRLEKGGIRISMDGRGRWMDNVFIERLWRSLKHEDVYLEAYADGREAQAGIAAWIAFYNTERFHQALSNRTPMLCGATAWRPRLHRTRGLWGCGQRCRVDHIPTAAEDNGLFGFIIGMADERAISNQKTGLGGPIDGVHFRPPNAMARRRSST